MPKYDFHPDFIEALPELPTIQDFSTLEKIQAIRTMRSEMLVVPPREDIESVDRRIPGHSGDPELMVRVYTPRGAALDREPAGRPGILEIHGGGFILGTVEMMDPWCQSIAAEVDAVVVSVDYRLAPEHPFPAGLHDCYAALVWMSEHAAELGIDATRIAIAGQSAGGGLAAGTALFARDQGGPALCYQLLEIPEIDDRLDTPSMLAFDDTPFWNRPNAVWSWKHYLGPDHQGEPSIYAAPARAQDVTGLPPAYISTMELDPLRDEGLRYGMSMLAAGISVELHNYAGAFHGSAFLPEARPSRRNTTEIVELLKERLHR
jgi:acetyl esterase/lipase